MSNKIFIILITLTLIGCATNKGSQHLIQFDPNQIDNANPPAIKDLNFDSYGNRLNGILYQANGAGPHPTVVLLHGYPGNEKNLDLAQSMRRAGYNVLFFHYRGAWGSGGNFSFSNVVQDVGSSIDYLRTNADSIRVDPKRILLIGHSMGGFAAIQGAAKDEAIKCVAGIAPADVGRIADIFQANPTVANEFAKGADSLSMLNGWPGEIVITELNNNRDAFSLVDLAPKLNGKSVLLVAGNLDKVIPPETFHTPLVAAYSDQPNISLTHTTLPGDHAFSWSRFQLIETVINWAIKCEGPK